MDIRSVIINTYRRDLPQARVCVASIRHWYPDIPIRLIKDMGAGDFDTAPLEELFGVGVLDTGRRSFGWGFGKLEPVFGEGGAAFLFMDADTVMTGPVLDRLASIEADFIVDEEVQPKEKLTSLYYDTERIAEVDAGFTYPGYSFNTGQWAATPGLIKRSDFDALVDWKGGPSLRHPHIFKQADQGVFNYVLQKKEAEGAVRVVRTPLMIWPSNGAADHVDLQAIRQRRPTEDRIVHWAGMGRIPADQMPRKDIIAYFRGEYYRRAGIGRRLVDLVSVTADHFGELLTRVSRRLSRMLPSG